MHEARLENKPNRKMNVPLAAKTPLVEGVKEATFYATVRAGTDCCGTYILPLGNTGPSFVTLQTRAFLFAYADVLAGKSLQARLHDTLEKGGEKMKPPDGSSETTVMWSKMWEHFFVTKDRDVR